MTPRDLAFWLQGYFEIAAPGDHSPGMAARFADIVTKHCDLVLKAHPGDGFTLAVRTMSYDPHAVRLLVAAHFDHVIDATFTVPLAEDPAHGPSPHPPWTGPHHVYRC